MLPNATAIASPGKQPLEIRAGQLSGVTCDMSYLLFFSFLLPTVSHFSGMNCEISYMLYLHMNFKVTFLTFNFFFPLGQFIQFAVSATWCRKQKKM